MKKPASILIVDDNLTNLKLARIVLESGGYEVTDATNSVEVFDILESFHPQLILMDLQLPGMSGLEITRLLKGKKETQDIIILAITAYAMKGDEEKAIEAGCDGYITKPINTRTLSGVIEQYLTRRETP